MSVHTFHIHVEGQVQGVGFRPFVYKLARQFNLKGWVNNTVDGVHVVFNAKRPEALAFYQALIEGAPVLARITSHRMRETAPESFGNFGIRQSRQEGRPSLLIAPDFALCDACRAELTTATDRRFGYPFITCTLCGPRFSIMEALPYDRERTAMRPYTMCPSCREEYEGPLDRRYYSQTNSCPSCGIRLSLFEGKREISGAGAMDLIQRTAASLKNGKTIAVKGIGGYLLCCDAADEKAVALLRRRKARPSKPFALMYPDLETLRGDVFLSEVEAGALTGPRSPILLLDLKENPRSGLAAAAVAPALDQIGAMLPYAPLFELLLRETRAPLVATSANLSNAPIIFDDSRALDDLQALADGVLTHDRPIVTPQDDSVLRFTRTTETPVILRRSRGLAPTLLLTDLALPLHSALAMGAALKSTFALLHERNTYLSQYLGDLDSFGAQNHYRQTLEHFLRLFGARPELILADKHPNYFSTRFGEALAKQWDVPFVQIQHHKAHFGAILAESGLTKAGRVLGIIWDGTGLGDDGHIWGGETFLWKETGMERLGQMKYFDFFLGDKMAREPRISALAVAGVCDGAEALLRPKFTGAEWRVYRRLLEKPPALKTSSVGRLFDAVASLLGVMDRSSYEGEAAMRLEHLAGRYFRSHGAGALPPYDLQELMDQFDWDGRRLPALIIGDLKRGVGKEEIAAKFHLTLTGIIGELARRSNVSQVCFSGGVFQNGLLVDLIQSRLAKEVGLHFHREMSPNDENVSFGQLLCHLVNPSVDDNSRGPEKTGLEKK